MQMTERLVTKAAASAARAQPAESRDRKYDKHLSYSATWGRSAVRAGSRGGGGGGQKYDPEAQRPRYPQGFRNWSPGRARAAASAAGTLPDASVSGLTSDPQRSPNGRMGAPARVGGRKCPMRAVALAQHSKWVTKSTVLSDQDGRNRVASFVAGCAAI